MSNDRPLFDPARLPPRDEYGFTFHPDLEDTRWEHPEFGEEYLSSDAIRAAGFEPRYVQFEYDAPEALCDRYYEFGVDGEDGATRASAEWQPTAPDGEGWVLVGIWDTEDGPCAMFVRHAQAVHA